MDRQMSEVCEPIIAPEGVGHDPSARYQDRAGPPTDRVA
ncbi:hypothetical protein MPS_5672 [Mycobacterium pseudoshottsii JCM 15466]|nr:hypothetical protein MPS_5672 [Mycobacterium pseudoshottsii JCM 15466]